MKISPSQKMLLWNYQKSSEIVDDASRKLSSAMRINSASDDPSDLARAIKMKASARGANTAIQNVSDGIKMVRTIDAPLGNIQKMILRIRDLALRASNDAVLREDCQDRYKLNLEAQALIDEIDRESKALTYNTKRILSGNRVELIEPILSTKSVIAANAFHPGWSALDGVTYTARVEASGPGTGPRPGTAGADFSYRAFVTEIDDFNAPVMTTQLTTDPTFYTDADGDGYYDFSINDRDVADPTVPGPPQTDADGDGFPVLVDNDDSTPVPGDVAYTPAASSTSQTFVPVNNVANRQFTAPTTIDELVVNSPVAGNAYYSDNGGFSYNLIGAFGAGVTNFGSGLGYAGATDLKFEVALGQNAAGVSVVTLEDPANASIAIASTTYTTNPNPVPDNRADYNLATLIGDTVDEINFTVAAGVNYTLTYRSAITGTFTAWGNTVGTGGVETVNLGTADEVNYIRIQLQNYNDVTTDFTLNSIVNRRDRDGDGYPDIIERTSNPGGTIEKDGALYPFGATHAYAGGINDIDGDSVPDYPTLYDDYDGTGPSDPRNASQLDLGSDWTDGTGNTIIQTTPGAQYPVDVVVNPVEIPSNTDTDGDTLPDPYDPFLNDVEFTTWVDGGMAYKDGGSVYFASNRRNPNDPAAAAQELYTLDNGDYSIYTASGVDVSDPVLSEDGTALAWEQGNEIWISYIPDDCSGGSSTITKKLVDNGENPTWSYDNSKVAYDRGGRLYYANVSNGAETDLNINGENPAWSPDGDNIAFVRGGRIYVYNMAADREYDTGVDGDDPAWSPDGGKMAFVDGTDVAVVDFSIEKDEASLQVGGGAGDDYIVEIPFPDVRATAIGVNTINLLTQDKAVKSIDLASEALDEISKVRADVGESERTLLHILDELNLYNINLEAGRSKIEDADMAAEMARLVRGQIFKNTSEAFAAQASSYLEQTDLSVLDSNLMKNDIRTQFSRMVPS